MVREGFFETVIRVILGLRIISCKEFGLLVKWNGIVFEIECGE